MKVLQVFNVYVEHGGEANSVERIARHLELGGHDVIRHRKESSSWLGSNAPTRWKQPFLLYSNKTALDEIRKIHVREKPDVWLLHNVVPVVSLGIYRIAGELGVPVVQWLHNYRPISPGGALRAFSKDLAVEDRFRTWKEVLSGSWRGRLMTLWLV